MQKSPQAPYAAGFMTNLGNRGDWQNLEREIQPYVLVFVNGPDPVLLRIAGMLRQSARFTTSLPVV